MSEPLARLGELVGRCVMGLVPVHALCGVGVCFLLASIVSVWSMLGCVAVQGQCVRKVYING